MDCRATDDDYDDQVKENEIIICDTLGEDEEFM
jgi:hypothetical protein